MSDQNHTSVPFEDVDDKPILNIKAVATATGIESVTLRAWERRYGVPLPGRAHQGYRLYSERDVAVLTWLKTRIEEDGLTIKRAVALLHSHSPQLADLAPSNQYGLAPHSSYDPARSQSLGDWVKPLVKAAHSFDSPGASQMISQAFAQHPVEDVCMRLLLPALAQIGQEWEIGDASVQVEHFISNMIRTHLLSMGASMPMPWRNGRVVAGCAPNEWHEIGVLLLSLFLRRRGWEVIFLGQAVGLDDLSRSIVTIKPDVLLLSSAFLNTASDLMTAAEIALEAGNGHMWFVYGGPLFNSAPDLEAKLPGVFAGRLLTEACDRIDALLSGSWSPDVTFPSPPPQQVVELFNVLKYVELRSIDEVNRLLLQADPDLTIHQSTEIAQNAFAGLLSAVRFNMPGLMRSPANAALYALSKRGITSTQLEAVFTRYVPLSHMELLQPFLEAM